MGLFDWVKRKLRGKEEKPKKGDVRTKAKKATEAKTVDAAKAEIERKATDMPTSTEGVSEEHGDEVISLVAEYERLVKRREQLQAERGELTEKLDRGEISPTDFRKKLMSKIQEASTVSDKIKRTSSKLTQLGYRGVLH